MPLASSRPHMSRGPGHQRPHPPENLRPVQHATLDVVLLWTGGHMFDPLTASGDRSSDVQPMSEVADQQALLRRLNRIEGQIRGIRRMLEEPRPCIEVLQQLAAAEAALNRISLAMFRRHIDHCVWDGLAEDEVKGRRQLDELIDIFDRFAK